MAEIEKVGFVGLGIMGGPMARNLREAGFDLSVYTRSQEKAERFAAEHGARAATTPAEAAEGADADGPSAVHVAMSNTLNTPIEALELEFPLRALEYALRRGSGGGGRRRGGDGVVRELEALAEMRYSLITERRRHAPPGAEGGEPGARGRNLINGEELPGKASGTLKAGDRLRIETPGGGGHGRD